MTAEEFDEALRIIQSRCAHLSNEELLNRLRQLLARYGTLSGILIDEAEDMPSSTSYRYRFGSLVRAYTLIGFRPSRDFSFIEINRALRQHHAKLLLKIVVELRECGAIVDQEPTADLLTINREFTASVVLVRCRETQAGNHRWLVRLDNSLEPDVTVAARLRPGNEEILDYYLLPSIDRLSEKLRLAQDNGVVLDVYRFDNLNFFVSLDAEGCYRGGFVTVQAINDIPIAEIRLVNPRSRNKIKFQTIVSSIKAVGLKRPITVVKRPVEADGTQYDLVCGQGRMEAMVALGENTVPALVVDAPREEQLLMSLVENIARRPPSNRELIREVRELTLRKYGPPLQGTRPPASEATIAIESVSHIR